MNQRANPVTASPDRLELMQTFVRIVEAGSLSAAAAQLGATQPTVSRRLQALERSLGVRLLQRSTRRMKLTEDGERCFERARELLAGWDAFESDLRGVGAAAEGTLRVVAPHAFGQQQLVAPLADYLRRNPGVSVEWLLHDIQPDFITQAIDCALQVGDVDDAGLVALKLWDVPRIVVGSPALLSGRQAPAHAAELAALPWLALRTYYRTEVTLTHAASGETARVAIRPRMSTDSLYALRSAALLGLGACIASTWVVAEDIAQGRLVQLAPQWRASPLPAWLLYPYARFYPARLRRFVETMREARPSELAVPT
ncbi:MAG: LysR family transcriptional regulator [Comamonadaceae bacterium]|nr:MAG: LysR family transcriptional regulator [Comamonadaceae bacterium]